MVEECFWLKGKRVICILLLIMYTTNQYAQALNQDELTAVKMWMDEDGEHSLYIKVKAACNNYDSKRAFDFVGVPSSITLRLKNDYINTTFVYDHPQYESSMLMFYSEAVWFKTVEWKQAIFIPLFYCSQKHGAIMPLTYLILYKQEMKVVHLSFYCAPEVWGSCRPVFKKREVKQQLANLPVSLQNDFMQYLEKTYTTREDLFPNHMTFKEPKYKDWNLGAVVSIVEASYPHELLSRLKTFIEDDKFDLAAIYLNEFEYLYVNQDGIVEIAGFRTQSHSQNKKKYFNMQAAEQQVALDQASNFIEEGEFQQAYDWFKSIMDRRK